MQTSALRSEPSSLSSSYDRDVLVTETFSIESLRALIAGEVLVLRVPNFASEELCRRVTDQIQAVGYEDYVNAPTLGRIGMSFYETGGKQERIDHFFETAMSNIHVLRDACAPYACPIDVLRCSLDEMWPTGSNLQILGGKKMFVGLSRNMRPGTPMLAHHDMFGRHSKEPEANDVLRQMAANVYISLPEVGGELVMWKNEITDAEFLARRGDKYGMFHEDLGEPDLVVKPQLGDFILFNARKMHGVAAGSGCDRLTFSCFVGYRGDDKPLTVWS